jgi:hypothetical protein
METRTQAVRKQDQQAVEKKPTVLFDRHLYLPTPIHWIR